MPTPLTTLIALTVLLLAPLARAEAPPVDPEAAGFSAEDVQSLDTLVEYFADRGLVAGGVAAIERNGALGYLKAFGRRSLEDGDVMQHDSIFRIYSMTKPITSAALMMLHEESLFELNDPVEKYLPDLANLQVAVEDKDAPDGYHTVPAKNPPTILDLLRHTAGFAYGLAPSSAADRIYSAEKILSAPDDLEDLVRKLGKLPLKHQPGTTWDYSIAVDVQGRLIEVLSGKTLDVFFQERIFDPLGMVDTGFHVPEEKSDRLAGLYALSLLGKLSPGKAVRGYSASKPPAILSGGGGLVSTAHDYLQFCRMMLNGGELDGHRLLKEETVALMTRDHLGAIPIAPIGTVLGLTGAGFGLGVSVTKEPGFSMTRGFPGEYNWGGAASTIFWIDPQDQHIGIYLIQLLPANYSTPIQFKNKVYSLVK